MVKERREQAAEDSKEIRTSDRVISLWLPSPQQSMLELGTSCAAKGGDVMKTLLLWIAVPLLLLAASMLIAGIGTPGLWIAVVAVGIALVVIGQVKPSTPQRR
jgi:Flp pilus assembly protein TadB